MDASIILDPIVLDPGHGGTDPGAINGNRYESVDTLRLGKKVRSLLIPQGINVLMTRESDTFVSLQYRTAMANKAGARLYVSLHRNSFKEASANGVEIWVSKTAEAVDEAAAGAVLEKLAVVGIQNNRGVKKYDYHVLRETKMTSMLVELGFISNATDNQLFDQHFDAYAEAIARGICSHLGVEWVSDTPILYGVVGQKAALSTIDAAQKYASELNQIGEGGGDWFWKVIPIEGTTLFGVVGQRIALSDRSRAEDYAAQLNTQEAAKPQKDRWYWKVIEIASD